MWNRGARDRRAGRPQRAVSAQGSGGLDSGGLWGGDCRGRSEAGGAGGRRPTCLFSPGEEPFLKKLGEGRRRLGWGGTAEMSNQASQGSQGAGLGVRITCLSALRRGERV